MQKRNEDLRFHSACEAPAIILIWSCPEGSYYGIYFNSRGLLHFFCTGQRRREKKKKFEAIRRMCSEPAPVRVVSMLSSSER